VSEKRPKGPYVIEVTLPLKIPKTLSYLVEERPPLGGRVLVPLKGRPQIGIVTNLQGERFSPLLSVQKIIDKAPLIPPNLLSFFQWIADYHLTPLGEVIRYALPSRFFVLPKRGSLLSFAGPCGREEKGTHFGCTLYHEEQAEKRLFFYKEEMLKTLKKGKQVLLLLPEQRQVREMIFHLQPYFQKLFVYDGSLPSRKRLEVWKELLGQGPCLVIGTRVAVFLPLQALGLIIVEHEEDPSYKEERAFRYQARDLALMRAKFQGAKVILGSEAPSVKSYYWALKGKYILQKGTQAPLTQIEIIDLGQEKGLLSQRLINACRTVLAHAGQVFLFLNRLGYAPVLQCQDCGYVWYCPQCQSPLRYHREQASLKCHLCRYILPAPPLCPGCGGEQLHYLGTGIERLHEIVQKLFPGVRIERYDQETSPRERDLDRIQILIGTRKAGYKLPLPRLKLIGVVLADQTLCLPDYQSAEKTYQLLKRLFLENPVRLLIQTFYPRHHVFAGLKKGYQIFFQQEINLRRQAQFPPFKRLVKLEWEGREEEKVTRLAEEAYNFLKGLGLEVLGPRKEKRRGFFRCSLLLKGPYQDLHKALSAYQEHFSPFKKGKFHLDWDPIF